MMWKIYFLIIQNIRCSIAINVKEAAFLRTEIIF